MQLMQPLLPVKSASNHNVNFRSIMAFGEAELCDEHTKRFALKAFIERLPPGLWDYARQPTEQEWQASKVVRLKLDEVSAKISEGLPEEDKDDLASSCWSGSIPFRLVPLPSVSDPKLRAGIEIPEFVKNFRYGK
jgi:uncharacterized protein